VAIQSPIFCRPLQCIDDRGADGDRGAVLVVVEDRDLRPSRSLRSTMKHSGALMS
jgi:hypothetical protein